MSIAGRAIVLIVSVCLSHVALAVDVDLDGSAAEEEILAGTSDNDAAQRPYWEKTFFGSGAGDQFGSSVSGAGDVNGDGYDDVIVGASLDDGNGADSGLVRVFSGSDGAILYEFNGGSPGDRFGWSVAAVSDVNGDG